MRVLPRSGCRLQIRSVAGLALAEEMLGGNAYAGVVRLGPLTTFIDLGCNVGWFPCVLREYGVCAAPVGLLIDADPEMIAEAGWHMTANGIRGECVWGAVGATTTSEGSAVFHVNPANTSSSIRAFGPDYPYPVKGRVRTISVPAIIIGDEWHHRFPNQLVDVLKVDIEGAEFDFLKSEGRFLSQVVRHIVCEWHAWQGCLGDLTEILTPLGFTLAEICEQDDKGGVAIFGNAGIFKPQR